MITTKVITKFFEKIQLLIGATLAIVSVKLQDFIQLAQTIVQLTEIRQNLKYNRNFKFSTWEASRNNLFSTVNQRSSARPKSHELANIADYSELNNDC